jgi:hypothetical protein
MLGRALNHSERWILNPAFYKPSPWREAGSRPNKHSLENTLRYEKKDDSLTNETGTAGEECLKRHTLLLCFVLLQTLLLVQLHKPSSLARSQCRSGLLRLQISSRQLQGLGTSSA